MQTYQNWFGDLSNVSPKIWDLSKRVKFGENLLALITEEGNSLHYHRVSLTSYTALNVCVCVC